MNPVKTLGDLRAAIADLPDSTSIVPQSRLTYLTAPGMHVIRMPADTTNPARVSFWFSERLNGVVSVASHDWPACAIYRGGKCSCD